MNEDELQRFIQAGRDRLTTLNHAIRQLDDWSDAFMLRGGIETFGNDAALIAAISNKVQGSIEDADRATVARLRSDV